MTAAPVTPRRSRPTRLLVYAPAIIVVAIVLFWPRIGLGAAIVILGGGLIWFAWRADRRAKEARAGLDRV